MKAPGITLTKLRYIRKIDHCLGFVFRLGLLFGVGMLVLGAISASFFGGAAHFPNGASSLVAAAAEIILSIACFAMAARFILEAYAYTRGFSKDLRLTANVLFVNLLAATVLLSSSITLGVFAIRDLLQ